VSRRTLAFVVFAALVSAGCVRLGFWQLHRLGERRARNATLAARLDALPEPVRDVLRSGASALYRRATASGVYDFANEVAVAARTHQGSPGVNIVTPLRIAGTDTAVLVNRGWVYAPDAMTAHFARWVEADSATVTGYLVAVDRGGRGTVSTPTDARVVRRLDVDSLEKRLGYPLAGFMLVALDGSSEVRDSVPARLTLPPLDEGPHLGYALQWFAFALIGLIGAGFSVHLDRRGARGRGSRHAL
jgi:surfeit locus 1 family protein